MEDKWCQVDTDAAQCGAAADHAAMLVVPPLGKPAIKRNRMEFALCAAPLDAVLADIARDETAHTALAPLMTPSAHPMVMLSSPPRPTSYVGMVLATMGGSPTSCFVIASVIGSTIAYR
jgi:hypothetical protein